MCFRYLQLTLARFCRSQSLRNSSSLNTELSCSAKSTILCAKFMLHLRQCSMISRDSFSSQSYFWRTSFQVCSLRSQRELSNTFSYAQEDSEPFEDKRICLLFVDLEWSLCGLCLKSIFAAYRLLCSLQKDCSSCNSRFFRSSFSLCSCFSLLFTSLSSSATLIQAVQALPSFSSSSQFLLLRASSSLCRASSTCSLACPLRSTTSISMDSPSSLESGVEDCDIRIQNRRYRDQTMTEKMSLCTQQPPWLLGQILKTWANRNSSEPSILRKPLTKTSREPARGPFWTSKFMLEYSMVSKLSDSILSEICLRPVCSVPVQVIELSWLQKFISCMRSLRGRRMALQQFQRKMPANCFGSMLAGKYYKLKPAILKQKGKEGKGGF